MKVYKLKCEILTPIHIGAGTELQPYEYVILDDQLHKISLDNFILGLSDKEQEQAIRLMAEDIVKLRQFLKDNFDPSQHKPEYSISVSQAVRKIYDTKIGDELNQLLIRPFIRTMNKPYVPGSSIKGAIRTAVVAHFSFPNFERSKPWQMEPKILNYGHFDKMRGKFRTTLYKDPFRVVKVSDAFLPKDTTTVNEVTAMTQKGEIRTICEITHGELAGKPVVFNTEFRFDDALLDKNPEIRKKLDFETIVDACNRFYLEVAKYERDKYFRSKADVKQLYSTILSEKLDDRSFLMRLGWGSGKNSVTLNLMKQRPDFVKTRKLIEGTYPLGWVRVSLH